jgi:cyclic pyranopterin phosphate synthase
MIEIYTDGSCLANPGGPGGWAAIVVENGSARELVGGDPSTTNNRMEMLAVVNGLRASPDSATVTVFSDSEYVVNTMTRSWKRRKNQDIWEMLDTEVARRQVRWEWVRGHSGHPLNEQADRLAREEAKRQGGEWVPASAGTTEGTGFRPPPERREARKRLTHLDESGTARMVDVGAKPVTGRAAVARGAVTMKPETLALIRSNGFEKGDVLGVARVAGVMAAKSTSQLIPLCHPLPLDVVTVDFKLGEDRVSIEATAKTSAKTGVEMEAMTAVSVAALTVYDMCKSADRSMRIEAVRLVRKTGGKSGDLVLEE